MISATAKRVGAIGIALTLIGGVAVTAFDRTARYGKSPASSERKVGLVVPIVAYDRFSNNGEPGTRDIRAFRSDLERLYTLGFRPVLLSDYVHRRIQLEPSTRPVVITFDASDSSQFRLLPKGEIDPASAVGVWYEFAQDHPSFPLKATFLLNPDRIFGDPSKSEQKLTLLKQWGSEFGCVPLRNSALGDISERTAAINLERTVKFLSQLGVKPTALALPYGQYPRDRDVLRQFEAVLLPGAEPAPPCDGVRELQALPRIQGDDSELGLTKWLDRIESGTTRESP